MKIIIKKKKKSGKSHMRESDIFRSKIIPNQTKTSISSWLTCSVAHMLNKSFHFHSNIVDLRMCNWAEFKPQQIALHDGQLQSVLKIIHSYSSGNALE